MATAGHEKEALAAGEALQAAREDDKGDKKTSSFQSYLRIFRYGRPADYAMLTVGILGALGSGTALAMVNLVIGDFITVMSDFAIMGSSDNLVSAASTNALYFVYIGIARLGCTYIYSTMLTYTAFNLTRNIRYEYVRSALRQEVGFFDQGSAGSISMQATVNGRLIQNGIAEKMGQIFQAAATFVAAFIIAFVSYWRLTLILSCMIPALVLIVGTIGAIDAGIEAKIIKIYGQAGSFAEATLSSIRTIHAFGLGPRIMTKYSVFLDNAMALGNRRCLLYAIMFSGEYFVMYSGMALAFWQGINMIASGEVADMGTIFTVLFSVMIASSTLTALAPNMVVFGRAATAAAELFELIDRESKIDPLSDSGETLPQINGEIELSNISFSYPTRPDVTVLDNFSLAVPAGKVTALVGASGSGKSTIVGLLERWYSPSHGSIKLDDRSIDELNLHWLRTQVRLVQQEPVLFNGTVLENICHGLVGTEWASETPERKLELAQEAAKTAFAHDFILELPQQYDTRVGERGGLLSGGQKQRVAIARSIISKPKVLLLDEATSALDPHAEGIVQKALDAASRDRTTIVIAHKLRTIQDADNIVVMKKGQIVEQGRHDQLVAKGAAYAALVKAQDLSTEKQDDSQSEDSQDDEMLDVQPTKSFGKTQTSEATRLTAKYSHQDYSQHKLSGVVRTIFKLVAATPEIRSWYAVCIISSVLAAGIYPGQALLLGRMLDVFGGDNMTRDGNFLSLMFFVMALGIVVVFGVFGWATNIVAQTFSKTVRYEILQAYFRQDPAFFDRPENTVGALTSKVDSYAQSAMELMSYNIALVLISLVSVVVCGILSIVYSWRLGLVGVFAGLPPMLLAGYARIRLETNMDAKIDAKFSVSASIASESVTAIRTVSSLALEEDVLRRYADQLDVAVKDSAGSLFNVMIWYSFTQSIEYFILALGFWWGSVLLNDGRVTLYEFFVSFMSVYFSGQGAGQMFGFSSSFTKANAAGNYFFWIRDLTPNVRETKENQDNAPKKDCDSYDFQNVEFVYPLAPNNRVLKGIDLEINPGQFVAFVGASGCGKSTMIALLERYYDPASGSIIIDKADALADLSPSKYRHHVSLVQQEPTLFPGSIRENVSMGVDEAGQPGQQVDDKTIEAACRAANAWDFVSSLPEGLATPCGTSGSQLSGGQRQRIAIARALIRNPRVILLDEATSALDTESERVVQAALMDAASSATRITIAVAHRLSTIRHADRIFVFYGGRIAEAGTHDDLIAQGGMYKKMCEAQSLDVAV